MNIKDWIKKVQEEMLSFSKHKPKDRLDYINSIYRTHLAVAASLQGWREWLESPGIMNNFSEEELNEIYEGFKKEAIFFLEYDIKWTKILAKKFDINEKDDISEFIEKCKEDKRKKTEEEKVDKSYIR